MWIRYLHCSVICTLRFWFKFWIMVITSLIITHNGEWLCTGKYISKSSLFPKTTMVENILWPLVHFVSSNQSQGCSQTCCRCEKKLRHINMKRPHRQDLCCRCKGMRLSCDATYSFKYIVWAATRSVWSWIRHFLKYTQWHLSADSTCTSRMAVASSNRLEEMHLFSCQWVDESLVVLFEATPQKPVLVSLL